MKRKELHQEIEQLIHSIKLHYHHINEETRIPTIELELITAKIRKLHEKSILYNHLHYLEEQGLILTRAQSAHRASTSAAASASAPGSDTKLNAAPASAVASASSSASIAAEAASSPRPSAPVSTPVSSVEPSAASIAAEAAPSPRPSAPVSTPVSSVEPSAAASRPVPTPSTAPQSAESKDRGQDLNSFVSFNDRYVFISKLFWGNADEYKRGITTINAAATLQEAEDVVRELGTRFKWDSDNEAVKLFHTIVQRMFSR